MDRARMPAMVPGRRHPDWHSLYEKVPESEIASLPWHFPAFDPDVKRELLGLRPPPRRVLDLGCGLGNQSHFLSEQKCEVTGTDISRAAIARARSAYPHIHFLVDDITRTSLVDSFDLIVDRGCFHVLESEQVPAYLTAVHGLLRPMGLVYLKVLSNEHGKVDFGPQRFSMLGLLKIFSPYFEVLKIRRTVYQGSTPQAPKAWFTVMRNKEGHGPRSE